MQRFYLRCFLKHPVLLLLSAPLTHGPRGVVTTHSPPTLLWKAACHPQLPQEDFSPAILVAPCTLKVCEGKQPRHQLSIPLGLSSSTADDIGSEVLVTPFSSRVEIWCLWTQSHVFS